MAVPWIPYFTRMFSMKSHVSDDSEDEALLIPSEIQDVGWSD